MSTTETEQALVQALKLGQITWFEYLEGFRNISSDSEQTEKGRAA